VAWAKLGSDGRLGDALLVRELVSRVSFRPVIGMRCGHFAGSRLS
jgi:hypothetical protein